MCVPYDKRTIKDDEFYDMVIELMIKNKFCEKYVSNQEFITHMKTYGWDLRSTKPSDGEGILNVAQIVLWYFSGFKLEAELEQYLSPVFFPEFNKHERFSKKPPASKKNVALNTLYYCLGMITLDYIQYNNL